METKKEITTINLIEYIKNYCTENYKIITAKSVTKPTHSLKALRFLDIRIEKKEDSYVYIITINYMAQILIDFRYYNKKAEINKITIKKGHLYNISFVNGSRSDQVIEDFRLNLSVKNDTLDEFLNILLTKSYQQEIKIMVIYKKQIIK